MATPQAAQGSEAAENPQAHGGATSPDLPIGTDRSVNERYWRCVPPNASDGDNGFCFLSPEATMTFDAFLLQLLGACGKLAQLNEPSLATMGVFRHLGGGTAHESQED